MIPGMDHISRPPGTSTPIRRTAAREAAASQHHGDQIKASLKLLKTSRRGGSFRVEKSKKLMERIIMRGATLKTRSADSAGYWHGIFYSSISARGTLLLY